MKILLASLMFACVSLAAHAEVRVFKATHLEKAHGPVYSMDYLRLDRICGQAHRRAESKAIDKCLEAGYTNCNVVRTAILSTKFRRWLFSDTATISCKVSATAHALQQ